MGALSRAPRPGDARPSGQHFIRSPVVATELVRDAAVGWADHVVEIGAGTGRLTSPLAEHAGRITAVEIDQALVEKLRRTFAGSQNVRIVHGDIMRIPLPADAWRAFGNIPFALTTPILRRLLDDPEHGPERTDLVVQFEAARKRASVGRTTLLSLGWLPWWEMRLTRRIPRMSFDPPPAVDAGLLTVDRRAHPLLEPEARPFLVALLRRAFDRSSWPIRRSLRDEVPGRAWKRIARDRGLSADARPWELDVWAWVALCRASGDATSSASRAAGARLDART